jgi:hypothetical protein
LPAYRIALGRSRANPFKEISSNLTDLSKINPGLSAFLY